MICQRCDGDGVLTNIDEEGNLEGVRYCPDCYGSGEVSSDGEEEWVEIEDWDDEPEEYDETEEG